jgi:hypothetical protein
MHDVMCCCDGFPAAPAQAAEYGMSISGALVEAFHLG